MHIVITCPGPTSEQFVINLDSGTSIFWIFPNYSNEKAELKNQWFNQWLIKHLGSLQFYA